MDKVLMNDDKEKALQELSDMTQEFDNADKQRDAENDAWWESLTEKERQDAFYAVCKRIHEGEVVKGGSYRYVLYDVFGFDNSMYVDGMRCGYMALHNALGDGEDYQAMRGVNRLEVIDDTGRICVKYLDEDERVRYNLQDDNRTLKVFIDKVHKIKLEDL